MDTEQPPFRAVWVGETEPLPESLLFPALTETEREKLKQAWERLHYGSGDRLMILPPGCNLLTPADFVGEPDPCNYANAIQAG